jgi:hypothetical protein
MVSFLHEDNQKNRNKLQVLALRNYYHFWICQIEIGMLALTAGILIAD